MTILLGVDIGGSGIKGALVDVAVGDLTAKRHRIVTPQPATPEAVMAVVALVADHFDWSGLIGCGLPAVVRGGVAHSAANIDDSWIGTDAVAMLERATGSRGHVVNDADAAGLAEMRFGAGRGQPGVVLVLTFGSGIGSALFENGRLVPNTELGHIEFHGMPAEHYAAARLVEHEGMSRRQWSARVGDYLSHLMMIFSPSLIVLGGGISKHFDSFGGAFDFDIPVVAAQLANNAGIVGAALAAHDAMGKGR